MWQVRPAMSNTQAASSIDHTEGKERVLLLRSVANFIMDWLSLVSCAESSWSCLASWVERQLG